MDNIEREKKKMILQAQKKELEDKLEERKESLQDLQNKLDEL